MDRTGSYLLLLKAKNFQDQGRQTNFKKKCNYHQNYMQLALFRKANVQIQALHTNCYCFSLSIDLYTEFTKWQK
jgi:hypothetical protein